MKLKAIVPLLSAVMWCGLFSSPAWAVATVDTADEFLAAIEGGEKEIQITGTFTLARQKSGLNETLVHTNNDFIPIRIPAGTHIYGSDDTVHEIGFRFPMQLEGDVTIEKVGLVFSSTTEYQRVIFMGGYTLTLKDIQTATNGRDFSLYAGSFDFATEAPKEGSAAHLIIDAPNIGSVERPIPDIGTLYLSGKAPLPTTFKAYVGTSALTISQKTRIGQVIAEGASIVVDGSGLQAVTTNYVTDAETTLTLTDGVTQFLTHGTFKEVVVPTGATLGFTDLGNDTTVSIGTLTGGGTMLRNASGRVEIQAYTGVTTLRSPTPVNGMTMVQTPQAPNDTHAFVLDSIHQNAGFELLYQADTEALTLKSTAYSTAAVYAYPDEYCGTVTGIDEDKHYFAGDRVTVTATAAEGYTFAGWWNASTETFLTQPTETVVLGEVTVLEAYFLPTGFHQAVTERAVETKAAGLAIGAPVIAVDGETVEVGITLQTASELPSDVTQWQGVTEIIEDSATFDEATSTLKVKLPANGKGFFQFVKADGLEE